MADFSKKEFHKKNESTKFEGNQEIWPDLSLETKISRPKETRDLIIEKTKSQSTDQPGVTFTKTVKTKLYREIEEVLEQDLSEIYFNLPVDKQQDFKLRGEQVASRIEILLKQAHINIKKIVSLIRDWLSMIPGVNRFFLEKEAKIKADKIVSIKENGGSF